MQQRDRQLNKQNFTHGPIIYWMQREHRVEHNWALLKAQALAQQHKQPLLVIFCLRTSFSTATERLIDFMLGGLKRVESSLRTHNIPFIFLLGDPVEEIPRFIQTQKAGALITEFHSLRLESSWRKKIAEKISIPFYEVDARNIVPCWIASNKQEYGAYTLRPKIHRLLPAYLESFPKMEKQQVAQNNFKKIAWEEIHKKIKTDRSIQKVIWVTPGEHEAKKMLSFFLDKKISSYYLLRNDPTKDMQSNLSPYLHFGHISSQYIALEIEKYNIPTKSKEALLEELIIRRELSDNYCYYNKDYDNINGFPSWAIQTLQTHQHDQRDYLYSLEELQHAKTHDKLWNAAQKEMAKRGKMHGYMRMYWAKKILEWSKSAEDAQKCAIYLNDQFFLDGRDSNGYTGIAWSIGGVHDRPWFERSVFGKIRFMNENGARKKFDIATYIKNCEEL